MIEAIAHATGCSIPQFSPPELPALQRWARSGLMALTRPADGAPLLPARDYCGRISEITQAANALARLAGMAANIDESVVSERAALLGLTGKGAVSANGSCHMVRACDGWLAVNLPREDDYALLPAWLGREVPGNVWRHIEAAAAPQACNKMVEAAQILGLAVAKANDAFAPPPVVVRMGAPDTRRRKAPLVLDLSSLWAGPLCGAVLAQAGADVIKLEGRSRPDGARFGNAAFFARLNFAKRMLALDLPQERATLAELFAAADVVIESARPRVLAQWGFELADIYKANPHLTWISITAYGRESARANWVGFGDDIAAAAGLVAETQWGPMFIGDALADPLTGIAAAAAGFASLAAGGGFLVDASLFASARFVAEAPPIDERCSLERSDGRWIVHGEGWSEAMLEPFAKPVSGRAGALGAESENVLREILG
jgi:hypothetical protein